MDKTFRKVLVAAHGPTHQMVRPDVSPVPDQVLQKATHTSDSRRARPTLQESLRRYDAHAESWRLSIHCPSSLFFDFVAGMEGVKTGKWENVQLTQMLHGLLKMSSAGSIPLYLSLSIPFLTRGEFFPAKGNDGNHKKISKYSNRFEDYHHIRI